MHACMHIHLQAIGSLYLRFKLGKPNPVFPFSSLIVDFKVDFSPVLPLDFSRTHKSSV